MKRIRLLVVAGVIAAAVPFGISSVGASGSSGSSSVSIQDKADYDFVGTNLDVGLQVRCSDSTGFGTVDVTVEQKPPQTPYPVGFGTGPQSVVCDGRTHSVAVTIVGAGFDAGKAKATATLVTPTNPKGWKTVKKTITIVVV